LLYKFIKYIYKSTHISQTSIGFLLENVNIFNKILAGYF